MKKSLIKLKFKKFRKRNVLLKVNEAGFEIYQGSKAEFNWNFGSVFTIAISGEGKGEPDEGISGGGGERGGRWTLSITLSFHNLVGQ